MEEEVTTIGISLRLPEELARQMDEKCVKSKWISRSEYIRHLILKDVTA